MVFCIFYLVNRLTDFPNDFEAGKNQNILRECDIDKIVETYERREDVDKYAHVATMQEIEENGFNLNIPRYVDTFEPEEEIDVYKRQIPVCIILIIASEPF